MIERGDFLICPHCWGLTTAGGRLCTRCGADPTTLLQESGGLRWTAPVQSPVPVGRGRPLSRRQRLGAAACLLVLALGFVFKAFGVRMAPAPDSAAAAPR